MRTIYNIIFGFSLTFLLLTNNAQAKLLDKIAGGIGEHFFTLSLIKRFHETMQGRHELAGHIYKKTQYKDKEILDLLNHSYIIKDQIAQLGLIVGDDTVEERVNQTIQMHKTTKKGLIEILKTKNLTYNEYFELVRQSIEFSYFQQKIIMPLVNVTDQEIKNYYYISHKNKKTLSFEYHLVDFTIPSNLLNASDKNVIKSILDNYRQTGNIPAKYSDLQTQDLGNMSINDLPSNLQKVLLKAEEGSFADPFDQNSVTHVFFVKSKKLTESDEFKKRKNAIYQKLFEEKAESISQNWLGRISKQYYIQTNI